MNHSDAAFVCGSWVERDAVEVVLVNVQAGGDVAHNGTPHGGDMSNSLEDDAQNSVTKPAARKCPLGVNASVSPKRRITANEM